MMDMFSELLRVATKGLADVFAMAGDHHGEEAVQQLGEELRGHIEDIPHLFDAVHGGDTDAASGD